MNKSIFFLLLFSLFLSCLVLSGNEKTTRKAEIDRELLNLQTQKKSVLNEIYRVELRQEKETIKLRNIQHSINSQTRSIEALEKNKKSLLTKIEETRQNLRRALRIMYKSQVQPSFLFLFQTDSFSHLYQDYHYFLKIFDYKLVHITQISEQVEALNKIEIKLRTEKTQLLSMKETIQNTLLEIRNNKIEHLRIMNKVNNDFSHFSQLLEELKEQTAELEKVISNQPYFHRIESINSSKFKGKMPRPLTGKLISRFGKIKSTKFDTYVYNNGIKIRPDKSDLVRSVFPGIVVFAGYFKGYGNLIIIRHSKELYTLYGHCQELRKALADWVQQDDVLALAGDTGSTIGKALYFEVRLGLKSEDPLRWFSKK